MYKRDKPPLKVRLRRWWKGYKQEAALFGPIRPLLEDLPGYYRVNRLYWALRHRTIDIYHKVDTKLAPGYYDIDTLMLHSAFVLLERFVCEEYNGVEAVQSHIKELSKYEVDELKDIPEELKPAHREAYERQRRSLEEALRLYKWWKEEYPLIEENDPWDIQWRKEEATRDHDTLLSSFFDRTVPCAFDKDGDPTLFELKPKELTPEQESKHQEILRASGQYKIDKDKEIEDNFISLIKLRKELWT